jgi:hypothetical protein
MFCPPHSAQLALLTLLFISGSGAASAQAAPPPAGPAQAPAAAVAPAPTAFAMNNLRPALANVQNAITNLNVAHWKAPNDIRATTQQDINSMQRDLNTSLPTLMAQADAAAAGGPAALSPAFAVFRNLDALYDVLLRVTETAGLAGSSSDASSLEEARAGLEDGRAKLGTWLLQAIGAQDAQVVRLQAPVAAHSAAAPPPPPNKVVVNDGPDTTKPHKKKPPPTPAPQ